MINGKTYNELAAECHANNAKWWHDLVTGEPLVRDPDELLMLILSELAEAMEAERKDLKDDKLPHRPGAEVELVDAVIRLADFAGGLGYNIGGDDELINRTPLPQNKGAALFDISKEVTVIGDLIQNGDEIFVGEQLYITLERIKHYAQRWNYDLDGAYREKSEFNKVRKDHSAESRLGENGKKW